LYAGRLAPTKGVHTAIRALGCLGPSRDSVRLDVLGRGDPDYERSLRRLVDDLGLSRHVTFREGVARDQMPSILAEYDVLIFPSEWEEPLARMPMEAMAAGLAVVGTTTGGSGELLRHDENALTFRAGDPVNLADQVRRLLHDPVLCRRLADTGRADVQARFTIDRMVTDLECFLRGVAQGAEA
jgi:glycosyltransferase involved in cell wall biosynthesis